MKKIISIFLVLLMLVSVTCSLTVNAANTNTHKVGTFYTSSDKKWKYYDGIETTMYYNPWLEVWQKEEHQAYYLSEYFGNETSITLPEILDGRQITGIGQMRGKITNIKIPISYNYVENCAFTNVKGLKTVTFSNEYTVDNAFVEFGAAFSKCKTLKKVVLPNIMVYYPPISYGDTLPPRVFNACSKLTDIVFPENIEIKTIGNECFKGCKSLKSITIPEGVTYIGEGAFENCTLLEKVVLPSTLESFRGDTFYNCKNIKEINIPNSLKEIDKDESQINAKDISSYFPKNTSFELPTDSPLIKSFVNAKLNVKIDISNNFDVNNDNASNIVDVSILQKYLAGKTPSVFNLDVADFNSDKSVNINDATYLQKILCLAILK